MRWANRKSAGTVGSAEALPDGKRPGPIELLELDIDLRIAELWADTVEVEEWSQEVVVAFMRAAYAQGYADALTEEDSAALGRDPASSATVARPLAWMSRQAVDSSGERRSLLRRL